MFEVRGGPSLERKKPSLDQPSIQGSFMLGEPASTIEGLVGFMFSPILGSPDGEPGTPSRASICLSYKKSQCWAAALGPCCQVDFFENSRQRRWPFHINNPVRSIAGKKTNRVGLAYRGSLSNGL
jgi:hypothetical protein